MRRGPRKVTLDPNRLAKAERIRQASLQYAQGTAVTKPSKPATQLGRSRMSVEYEAYMASPEWAAFREKVFRERGRKCQDCGSTAGEINVHHLHYRTFKRERLRDVKVLCPPCHKTVHRVQGKY